MNFDGRLEIFGIGGDANVYHSWQLSAAGSWSGWNPLLQVASNSGTTNGADMTYFTSDADDEAYYANMKGQQCPGNMPNMWRGPVNGLTMAWPCGGVANTSFVSFDDTDSLVKSMQHWNDEISAWYAPYLNGQNSPNPAFLALESGGPQLIVTKRTCDTCIPGDDPGTYGRGINKSQQRDASNRLASVEIELFTE